MSKITKKDFTFIQQDKKIHDLKFDTKPTTYLKDAWRRFLKNKSSVAGGIIIGILIVLAIFVPIFNSNAITGDRSTYKFLPPRWPGFENSNNLNGRRYVESINFNDLAVDEEDHHPAGYQRRAVVGEMEIQTHLTNIASPYVRGGKVLLRADALRNSATLRTNLIQNVDFGDDYVLTVDIDETLNADHEFEIFASVFYNGSANPSTKVILKAASSNYGINTVNNLSALILENRPDEVVSETFTLRVEVQLLASETNEAAKLYFNSLVVDFAVPTEAENPFALHNFTEANEVLLRTAASYKERYGLTEEQIKPYQYTFVGNRSLHEGSIRRASFTYDFYEEIFGEVERNTEITTLHRYKAAGYIDFFYEEGVDVQTIIDTFEVIDEKRSPIREIISGTMEEQVLPNQTFISYDFVVTLSLYREAGYTSMPYFLFGTNERGHDFFKVVFNGLRTSLMLGIGAATINILIGLVWGSISGYYGGNVDLAMERFTDILGGIPWIIVMTLTILHLGNNFGVFLLALVITGWIGISSVTRSQFYRYKRREYVLASRTLGAKDGRLIFKHILPNSIGPIVTSAVMMIPGVIFSEATISYLGLGLQGLTSFGVALSEAQGSISTNPYLIVSGSIVIALLMISFNLFGNGLRDAFNPSLKGVE